MEWDSQAVLTGGLGLSSHLRMRKRIASSLFGKILWPEDARSVVRWYNRGQHWVVLVGWSV